VLQSTGRSWDNGLYATLAVAKSAVAPVSSTTIWKDRVVHYLLIYLEDNKFPALESLVNQRTVAQLIHVRRETERLRTLTGRGKELGFLFSALILFLGALGVMAAMVTSMDALTIQ